MSKLHYEKTKTDILSLGQMYFHEERRKGFAILSALSPLYKYRLRYKSKDTFKFVFTFLQHTSVCH